MKNIKCIYESYVPKIIRSKNGIKYNLSEENIFGNLNYSMNTNLLNGKTIEVNSVTLHKNNFSSQAINGKPLKLIPIIKFKNN